MLHDASVSLRVKLRPDKPVATKYFERSVTGGAAQSARAFCFQQNKIEFTWTQFSEMVAGQSCFSIFT